MGLRSLKPKSTNLHESWSPQRFAEQLTLLEFDYVREIPVTLFLDWLHQPPSWTCLKEAFAASAGSREKSRASFQPLLEYIRFQHRFIYWIVNLMVNKPLESQRLKLLKYWLKVARRCRELQNFNGLLLVLRALQHPCIASMQEMWTVSPASSRLCAAE